MFNSKTTYKMIHAFKHFFFSELLTQCSRSEVDEILHSKEKFANLVNIMSLLDQMRDVYAAPIRVTSGYRNAEHNKRVNGSTTSQHMIGAAADIQLLCGQPHMFALAEFILNNPELFGQFIIYIREKHEADVHEFADIFAIGEDNYDLALLVSQLTHAEWIHVALPSANHKQLSISTKYINA